jgi:transcriptional regulator with XRE-family HTH domain
MASGLSLSELIKSRRQRRGWSLRQLANELDVTAAYVADLESRRRQPSSELLEKLARVLEIPNHELAVADVRLTGDLRDWVEARPELIGLLRSLKASEEPDMLIQRLARMIARRLKPKPVAARGFLLTWESELRAIAAEASAWSIETGGDLFGKWADVPTIFLASRAGPNAQRDHAHFRLDVDYLRTLSEVLAADWHLRYFGDWHSHHRLGLTRPSGGDQKRILNLGHRNKFPGMAEIIATMDDDRPDSTLRVHPWFYDLSTSEAGPYPMHLKVLPGISPVRESLLKQKLLPEQELFSWEKTGLSRIRIGADAAQPVLEPARDVDAATMENVLKHLSRALQAESQGNIERHHTSFGSVLAAKLRGHQYLALALGGTWPLPILEIHRLDRETGRTEVVDAPTNLSVLDIASVLAIYRREKADQGRNT